ncbi:hypothetical protein L204_102637 [Cryptococcus depauperatus]|nr:hypothetical protein L204_00615 [Cryptococcus depauperatus CBS 7855]
MKYFLALISFPCILIAYADTEIINFRHPLPSHPTLYPPLDSLIQTISPYETLRLNLTDTAPEKWLALDIKKDQKYRAWTLRASWPGSSPTRVTLQSPMSPGYFVIRAALLSPRFPHYPHLFELFPSSVSHIFAGRRELIKNDKRFETPLNLTLEPLLFNVLPWTALPAVVTIVLFITGAWIVLPYFIQGLEFAGEWAEKKRLKEKHE